MVNYYAMIKEIRDYADENNVPIMQDEGINFLTTYIIKNNIHNILEIGTAIGFSAIMMCLSQPNVKVTTIERYEKRYIEALKNIKKFKLEDKITLIYHDALDVKIDGKFDLVFIDAAKSQNQKFFEMFSKNLNEDGSIITDNMNFHGLVFKDEGEIKSKDLRALVRKVKNYKVFLENNEDYVTRFHNVGDGVAVSVRKK